MEARPTTPPCPVMCTALPISDGIWSSGIFSGFGGELMEDSSETEKDAERASIRAIADPRTLAALSRRRFCLASNVARLDLSCFNFASAAARSPAWSLCRCTTTSRSASASRAMRVERSTSLLSTDDAPSDGGALRWERRSLAASSSTFARRSLSCPAVGVVAASAAPQLSGESNRARSAISRSRFSSGERAAPLSSSKRCASSWSRRDPIKLFASASERSSRVFSSMRFDIS
mmetsp:Transcript_5148/g.11327  ORF Transcript_5148/g.11327 Transcript_5148/m.11327 type:complete len:233 (-) Transcript_5148:294-992(-)